MKLIFFSFKHRYRQKELNNFLKSRTYGKYFILNLGGPFRYFIAKLLIFLRIGRAISCDGKPLITKKSKGINFWMRGTTQHIPKDLKKLNNNFVTIDNTLVKDKKIFQIYPINIKQTQIRRDCKIIYISKIIIEADAEEKRIWEKYKVQMMEDFGLIDSKIFWEKIYIKENNELEKYFLYKKFKLLLRFEIIKNIKVMFDKNLHLIGDDWNLFSINSSPSNYNVKQIKKLYEGNICLDLGSMLGSVSLYPRSNQIIESGGLIIQSYQNDANEIWGNLKDKILFKNLSDLTSLINKLLTDKGYCSFLLKEISNNFRNSKKSLEKSLDKIFEQ
jgi:hypothetical protein